MYDYKFQIAAIAVMAIILVNYFRDKKLPLLSSHMFSVFLIGSAVNVLFDIATVYTINHLETVSPFLNRLAHQFFIGSLNFIIYMLFLYVNILVNGQRRLNPWKLGLMSLPLLLSVLMVVFGKLYYQTGEGRHYSYGPMASTVYLLVMLYMLCITVKLYFARNLIKRERMILIVCGMTIWVVIALVQSLHPQILASSLGNVLMVLLVYLSFETPGEHTDTETGTLNRTAFHQMTCELYARQEQFWLVNYVLEQVDYLQDMFGYSSVQSILFTLNKRIGALTGVRVFHSRSNVLTVLAESWETVELLMEDGKNSSVEWFDNKGVAFLPSFHMDVAECPKYAASPDKLYDLIDYLNQEFIHKKSVTVLDETLILEYQRYITIQEMVENAVANDGFEMYYQPIYSTKTGGFDSAEALVRLKDRTTLGYISPEQFIPIAEQHGLMLALGNQVFEKVCRFIHEQGLETLGVRYIEVNLSRVQCVDRKLAAMLIETMKRYEIPPQCINLEITETASVEAGDRMAKNMRLLRSYGCHFSMDDFGTGYSNLSQIASVRFELIKLDKSLLWPCFEENGSDARIILENCVNMILQLGAHIVAEGVETEEQVQHLRALGVNYLQGYYFSKPLCEQDYLAFLAHARNGR